ncbi:pyrroline-5-carboxylate reductase [Ideonella dechloratans]|jgi:pyrroline-5-carboxylate reductase|uniref:Pyrroline-5-carboxylate reductase n=1 Tax=Ideonella dechloratans TaxID=36863 RepID=A0A643FG18_IDEDE|nr:pyrroline-5-carboxylate reductase [Ideonella dechloratans]KAB0584594.1 pyrroline-5-carboxylate reductase [Ideonella dechloratans]UFU10308.1 pyrroline-5-carboxylate reductase [Ideonella dechloratans]
MNRSTSLNTTIAFIGGGNMASAIIGGLVRAGHPASTILVVEPSPEQALRLRSQFGVQADAAAGPALGAAGLIVWAVKPQVFEAAAAPCAPYASQALQLSIMAGIPCAAIEKASGSARVVRAMPNTPALIGQGMSGLYARPAVTLDERLQVEQMLAPTGQLLWVEQEAQLDAVTALSGSGPAYVFYLLEAMIQAGVELGLSAEQSRQLAQQTVAGAAALSAQSSETPEVLRQRVTSKGGTTHAAISTLEARGVKLAFVRALHAAAERAAELGAEFGKN